MSSEGLSDLGLTAMFDGLRAQIDSGGPASVAFFADASRAVLIGTVVLPQPCGSASPEGLRLSAATAQAVGAGVPGFGSLMNGVGDEILSGRCAADGVFTLKLEDGEVVYPGGELVFPGGLIGF